MRSSYHGGFSRGVDGRFGACSRHSAAGTVAPDGCNVQPVSRRVNSFLKRALDIVCSIFGLLLLSWVIALAWSVSAWQSGGNGFFIQKRVGRHGRQFSLFKIKTMYDDRHGTRSPVTTGGMELLPAGAWMRRHRIDELPQLLHVLLGQMSLVGPRPDVPGYADRLHGEERLILRLRPGITGPATLKFRDEEQLLAMSGDPVRYNDEVIWPEKVRLNLAYYYANNLLTDIGYVLRTLTGT